MNICYQGVPTDVSGYGQANRTDIVALYFSQVNIQVNSIRQMAETTDFGWAGKLCNQLTKNKIDYKIKIIHLTPDCYKEYLEKGKYHIGRLFWETDQLPKGWADACNQMNEIWTATEPQAEMIRKSGVTVPIYCFPQPIDLGYPRKSYEIKNFKGYKFYSIFQWIDRKNPHALVTTYWKTFKGVDDVVLIIKTYGFRYVEQEFDRIKEEILSWKKMHPQTHYPKILLVKDVLTTEQMMRLHATGNCFVTTTKGEGFCIPAVEAMLSSKPIIGIDKTGIFDLIDDSLYFPCKTKPSSVTANPRIPYYDYPQKWLDIDEEELGKKMLSLYKDSEKGANMGMKSRDYVINNLNFWKVGEQMLNRLKNINEKEKI